MRFRKNGVEYVDVKGAAVDWPCTPENVRRLIRTGKLPAEKLDGEKRYFIRVADIKLYRAGGER